MPGGKGKGKDYCHDWWPEMGKKRKEPEPTDEASKDVALDHARQEIARLVSRQNSLVTENNQKAKEIDRLVKEQQTLKDQAESRKCHCGQVERVKNCVLTTCGHTFARLNIGAWLVQRGVVQNARPGTIPFLRLEDDTVVGGLLGSYAPCPNCRV
eukprot:SAG22_NODE_8835_length_626_cov_85.375712_1_plen_154_part_10